ncbi:hypothetical protein [Streptomyces sp. NPDC005408]|uniref:hypothetical protein n=1 Tax=Streptomyces sp. NPDC005408 TaxID=3155341 RepID=UPI0033B1A5FE
MLRQAARFNDAWFVLEVSSDQRQFRMTTESGERPAANRREATPTGPAHMFGGMITAMVSVGDRRSYLALVDPTVKVNGWVLPRFTLDTVRQLADDTQADALRYGHDCTDTVHVIEGGTTDDGERQVIVVHVRWPYYEESPDGGADIVTPGDDGRYAIGGCQWTWQITGSEQNA